MKRNFVNGNVSFPGLIPSETLANYGENTLTLMYSYELQELLQHPPPLISVPYTSQAY